ncbi:MAG: alpha-galactosidase [Propionicimonas sp.]
MSTEGLPTLLHLRHEGMSVLFDLSSRKIPRIVHWGAALDGEQAESLHAIVIAHREAWDGHAPNGLVETGMLPLESEAWKGRPGLAGHRADGTAWAPRFTLVAVDPGGGSDTPAAACFRLEDSRNHLGLTITVELLAAGVGRVSAVLSNTGTDDYYLQELGLTLPVPLEADEILDLAGRWGNERHAQRRPVTVGCDLREGRRGRTGQDAPGMTFVGRTGFGFRDGEIWGLHTAFSGNHRTWVEKLNSGEQVMGGSELLLPGECILRPGESYRSPDIYFQYADGLDMAANNLHAWLRSRPTHPGSPRPVTFNVWEAVYFNQTPQEIFELARIASSVGVERFVLDDGWFRNRRNDRAGLGDWYVDTKVWPEGLRPLADHCRSLGMEFGLWFEPEMVNLDSDLARSHPDWILGAQGSSSPPDLPKPYRNQQVLNLTIPEAFAYIEDRVVSVVLENDVRYIKWDHNRDLSEAGDLTAGGRAAVSRQTRAFYALVDRVKARCPGVEIESCSSGGARVDLEVMQHTDRVWVSDCIDPVERQEMVRWTGQLLPPEMLGTHISSPRSHTTGRWSTMSMRGATALFGHFGIEWDIRQADEEERRELGQWVQYYRSIREFLHSGQIVRCDTPDPSLWLHGIVSPERDRGLFAVVTRGRSIISPRGRLRFAELAHERSYRVRPVVVGSAPSGLIAPPWFGMGPDYRPTNARDFDVAEPPPGIVMDGRALEVSGLQMPQMHPDQALLIELRATS